MAVSPNQVALVAPTYSGFWNLTGDMIQYAPFDNRAPTTGKLGWRSKLEWQIAKLADKQQMREITALMMALIGAAAGGTATKSYSRVAMPTGPTNTVPTTVSVADMGGLVPIESVSVINRATTAADIAYLKSMFNSSDMVMRGLTLAVDLSGNGANTRASMLGVQL